EGPGRAAAAGLGRARVVLGRQSGRGGGQSGPLPAGLPGRRARAHGGTAPVRRSAELRSLRSRTMRVTTGMLYSKGLQQIQAQTANLLRTQQQIANGRRILTPADDPVSAARALEIRQSKSSNEQFLNNQAVANDRLRTAENRLTGVADILQYVRERTVQAGNAALGAKELGYIATDLRAQFEALLGLANSKDAQGDYVFGGYQTHQAPYVGGFGSISYQGDDHQLAVQVSPSRFMP